MSKALKDLVASQAGVSQAVLEKAFNDLPGLEKEVAAVEKESEAAIATKRAAQDTYDEAKKTAQAVIRKRDGVFEEWQRASWIVRNADPDYPPPPTGIRPPDIKTPREG